VSGWEHSNSRHGQVSINGQALFTPASRVMNFPVFWSARSRGADVVLPYAAGQVSRRRRRDALVLQVELWVRGHVSLTGTPAGNPYAQLDTTMETLESAFVVPPSSNTGWAIVRTSRHGATKSTTGFVTSWEPAPHPGKSAVNVVQFELVVPSGVWT